MRVLLIGSGGREHALAWRLASSPSLSDLHVAPGNPGIAALGSCHPVAADDTEAIVGLARSLGTDLVVVGPEAPLVGGLADELRRIGIPVFGPGRSAAAIEGSKSFAKDVMAAAGVPTARVLTEPVAPCVVKADGLAAGKGVFVCRSDEELQAGLEAASAYPGEPMVEELLEGPEVSLFAICDGQRAVALPPARDYKRAYDRDGGPNTGGMGSFAPVASLDQGILDELLERIHLPVLQELHRRRAPFVGLLYAGLMLTDSGPRVIEFNCRFGDPETQSIMPLVGGDLLATLAAAAAGDVSEVDVHVEPGATVTVVLAAGSYPEGGDRGSPIEGVERAEAAGAHVFHAGTARAGGVLKTHGGRILNVTARGSSIDSARASAYAAVEQITFPGMRYRTDIAVDAVVPVPAPHDPAGAR